MSLLGCGWYRRDPKWYPQTVPVAHYFIGDGVSRSVAACRAYQFEGVMRSAKTLKHCVRCKAILKARKRAGTFPREVTPL